MELTERGTAAAESALVFGLVTFMLFSIIEFGLIMNSKIVVSTAAREGARKATVDGGGSSGAYDRIRAILASANIEEDDVTIDIQPREASYGTTIYVSVEYIYRITTPVVAAITGFELPIRAEVICRSERVRND
jgi:Flp pilus assembly protein TadG